ncbi:LysR substrate-binding domain-containing protein [Mangrovibrevibacter kandeliae]|uniref:LysR substrate-binding domain-containing protein n=1 Tax=Mangrovibrevibacter kandeliae TaxID=2968473 RepID=UPI00211895A6|nr:LysR substrate-binding domain-containing protein [Aurantimonas sp. CSK15Z-1]
MLKSRQLEAFRAVILIGSASEAAASLGISQPAVSRLIADLEQQLKLQLFERRGGKLLPTADGITLYREVDRSFVGLERIELAARDIRERRGGALRVAGLPALAGSFLPGVVAEFVKERPAVDITLYGMTSPSVLDWVVAGRCDVGFVQERIPHSAIVSEDLPAVPGVFAAPVGHPLLAKETIVPQDLHGCDLVALAGPSLMRSKFDAVMTTHSVLPVIRAETPLTMIACGLVSAGLGCAIVDFFTARHIRWPNVELRPFRPTITFEWSLITPGFSASSSISREFIETFHRRFRARIAEFDG